MTSRGDMFSVTYPEDTGPQHAPIDWPLKATEAEEHDMPDTADDMIYVDLYGDEVSPDDPAAQTKYRAAELNALRKGGFFPKRDGAPAEAVAADESHPVLNSGIGAKGADSADAPPSDDGADAAADDDEKKSAHRHVAGKK